MGDAGETFVHQPPEMPLDPMEYLSRTWSISALQVSKAITPSPPAPLGEDVAGEHKEGAEELAPPPLAIAGNNFSFASSATSQLVLERIIPREISPQSSGRLSHSSGCLTESPSSHSDQDILKYFRAVNATAKPPRTVGRWLKDRRERKRDEARAHNAQLHAALTVAGVAAAVAAAAAANAAATGKLGRSEHAAQMDMAMASAATLVAAHCAEAAEAIGAEHEHLAAVVGSAVGVRTADDIITLTAAAATALRGAAALKARALGEIWDTAAVIPVGKSGTDIHSQFDHCLQQQPPPKSPVSAHWNGTGSTESSGELLTMENFLGVCSQDVLARGSELIKRTRKGSLHVKTVSVYISKMGQVMLKMKSNHIAGAITKKKKCAVVGICKDVFAWPGRHLLEGGEKRRYFGLKTGEGRVIEFECRTQREHEIWTQGVEHLLHVSREGRGRRTLLNR